MASNNRNFETMLKDAIEREIERIINTEIKAAQTRIDTAIRAVLGNIALEVLSRYDVLRDGQNIVITVRNEL